MVNAIGKHRLKKRRIWPIWEEDFASILYNMAQSNKSAANLHQKRTDYQKTLWNLLLISQRSSNKFQVTWTNNRNNRNFFEHNRLEVKVAILLFFQKIWLRKTIFQRRISQKTYNQVFAVASKQKASSLKTEVKYYLVPETARIFAKTVFF